ncbi:hypothetical protein FHS24_000672 [Psychrobacter luti]|uniref:Uncharacterized protein n=1 Tax=Psychrobacter luti TaxID=198481 RepID=A0A839T9R5_9GAMM|nr:hypothetical protein [Psychrobacter luti]MBB3106181.1 hypothetical protein [Psychrobacter luti]
MVNVEQGGFGSAILHPLARYILGLSIANLAQLWAAAMHKIVKAQMIVVMIIVTRWFSVKMAAIVVRWHDLIVFNSHTLDNSFLYANAG